ncbi:MAG: NUDIX domain-containing protein [Actinomycetota bacterium]
MEEGQADENFRGWIQSVGAGIEGYVTPKTAVGAVVGNERGELLLTQRADTGEWFYPVGWADVGYSPSEVAVKEVQEETGIEVVPRAVVAVVDGLRIGAIIPFYSIVFRCEMVGGDLTAHPLETLDVGFFAEANLPSPLRAGGRWVAWAFASLKDDDRPCYFDLPRTPMWRTPPDG